MKKVILVLIILVVASSIGFAQFRADIGIAVPRRLGATLDGTLADREEFTIPSEFVFLVPQLFLGAEFGVGPVNLGVGGRIYTVILESVAIPAVFAEVELGPVAVNLNIAGGAFVFFGLANSVETGQLLLPDLSAHVKIGRSLQVGAGATAILTPDIPEDVLPYVFYLSGKFVIRR